MGCTQSQEVDTLDVPRPEVRSLKKPSKKNTAKSLASAPITEEYVDYEGGERAVDTLRADSKIHLALNAKRRGDIFDESIQPSSSELKSFDQPLVEKTEAQEILLSSALENNILFRDLTEDQLKLILNALTSANVEEGTELISQGDTGNVFYIVEEGRFSFEVNEEEVGTCGAGDSFGELALLYNCPRAATVRCLADATVWCLERSHFRHIIAGNEAKKQQDIRKALRRVSLLEQLSEEQVNRVSDAVETVRFKAGETILRKGDEGSVFFMIKNGQVKCTRAGSRQSSYDIILSEGEYFGERALLMDEPRAANVIAITDVECLVLDRDAFLGILGPLRKVLDTNLGLRVIGTIPMFSQLSASELNKMMQALKEERFLKNDVIIRQNDPGSKFYLIREGTAKVTKNMDGVGLGGPTDVAELTAGEYFGEGALLKDEPRAANVVATSDELVCLTMDRAAFEKLLGPLQKIMKRELDERDDQMEAVVKRQVSMVEETLKLSDLKIMQTLGTGTFGRVRLVSCEKLGRTYALKMLQKAQIVAYRQQKNVMNEKNILMECDHPFILKLYKTFRDKHSLYFLLEVVLGGELFTLLHIRGGALGNADARFYAACVLDAMEYLHGLTIVYRDLKPENLMISDDGYIKVVDFGFAKKVADKTYTLCGTPEYLAPELVLGKGHNQAVDNWAIGILIFEMLTGASPFADPHGGDHMVICKNIVRGKIDFPRRFPEKARDLVLHLLVRDAHQRLGSLSGGTGEIKLHPWFKSIDWNELKRKRVKAPWVPPIRDNLDTSNFDEYPEDDYVEPYKSTGTHWDADF